MRVISTGITAGNRNQVCPFTVEDADSDLPRTNNSKEGGSSEGGREAFPATPLHWLCFHDQTSFGGGGGRTRTAERKKEKEGERGREGRKAAPQKLSIRFVHTYYTGMCHWEGNASNHQTVLCPSNIVSLIYIYIYIYIYGTFLLILIYKYPKRTILVYSGLNHPKTGCNLPGTKAGRRDGRASLSSCCTLPLLPSFLRSVVQPMHKLKANS